MISWELLHIFNLIVAKVKAKSSSSKIASYLASLLEVGKPSRITCSSSSPVGDCKIRPTPTLEALDAPSTWSIHHSSLGESTKWDGFWGSSAIKSTMTCHFNVSLGWYLIPYSLNSMTHFSIRLNMSGLCEVLLSGWFVSIITWWAWKYGQSFWAALFKAEGLLYFGVLGFYVNHRFAYIVDKPLFFVSYMTKQITLTA